MKQSGSLSVYAVLALYGAGGLAQQQSTPTANQPKPASIAGRVLNALTGEPLRKATVVLVPVGGGSDTTGGGASARSVITTPEGAFQFANVDSGSYQLTAQRTGFLSQRAGAAPGRTSPVASIAVQAGQEITNIEIKLTPQGVIAGRVVDSDGDPVQGAQVSIMRVISTAGRISLTPTSAASTNDLGEFRAPALPQGRYYVSAVSPRRGGGGSGGFRGGAGPPGGRSRLPEGQKEDWVLTYFPSATNASGASPVEVRAGMDTAGLTIQLRRAPVLQVRGQVSGTPGQRLTLMLSSVEREVSSPMPGQTQMAQVAKDGTFAFRAVTPGSYQLIAQRMERRPVTLARVPVQVGTTDVEGVLVPLQEPVAVSGLVKFDASANAPADIGSTRIYLQPADGSAGGYGGASVEGTLKPDGSFTFAAVSRDRMVLYPYNLADGTYVRSVKMGNQEVIDTGIDLGSAGPQVQLEVAFGTNGGSVQGTVTQDGKPVPNYTVTAHPEPARPMQPWLTKTTTTDANGNFTFRTLPPGEYRLFAWEEIAKEFLADTDFLRRFETSGVRVTVKESSSQKVDLAPVNTTESKQ